MAASQRHLPLYVHHATRTRTGFRRQTLEDPTRLLPEIADDYRGLSRRHQYSRIEPIGPTKARPS